MRLGLAVFQVQPRDYLVQDRITVGGRDAEQAARGVAGADRVRDAAVYRVLEAEVVDGPTGKVRFAGQDIVLAQPVSGAKVTLASRPETIRLGLHTERETHLKAKITEVHFLGSVIRIRANVAGTILAFDTFNTSDAPPPKVGGEVDLSLAGRDLLVLND